MRSDRIEIPGATQAGIQHLRQNAVAHSLVPQESLDDIGVTPTSGLSTDLDDDFVPSKTMVRCQKSCRRTVSSKEMNGLKSARYRHTHLPAPLFECRGADIIH